MISQKNLDKYQCNIHGRTTHSENRMIKFKMIEVFNKCIITIKKKQIKLKAFIEWKLQNL